MRLVSFERDGAVEAGLLEGEQVFPLERTEFRSALEFMEGGETALAAGRELIARGEGAVALGAVRLMAPVPRPPRVFAIGLNYAEHAAESQMKTQAVPTVFLKLASSVVGPGAEVVLPRASQQVDYEAEFAVVIGRAGYQVKAADWERYVFGYTMVNDVSARDVQLATTQWTLGKSFPTFTPMGPWVVTKDEVKDPHALNITMTVAGEVLQSSNTRHLIFRVPELIAYISGITPLEVGDVISTGTPEGVGLGRKPQRWLQAGEEMVIAVEGIGELRNRCVAEKEGR